MPSCKAVQEHLAETGVEAAETQAEVRRHLEGCAACRAFLAEQRRLQAALEDLTSPDAPDSLVADTLAAVRAAPKRTEVPPKPKPQLRFLGRGLAASIVALAGLGLTLAYLEYPNRLAFQRFSPSEGQSRAKDQAARAPAFEAGEAGRTATEAAAHSRDDDAPAVVFVEEGQILIAEDYRSLDELRSSEAPQAEAFDDTRQSNEAVRRELEVIAQLAERPIPAEEALQTKNRALAKKERSEVGQEALPEMRAPGRKAKADGGYRSRSAQTAPREDKAAPAAEQEAQFGAGRLAGTLRANEPLAGADVEGDVSGPVGGLSDRSEAKREDRDGNRRAAREQATTPASVGDAPEPQPSSTLVGRTERLSSLLKRRITTAPPDPETALQLARNFLDGHRSLDGLAFQDAAGYWANSYIPGDPAIRLLEARLRAWDRRALGADPALERRVRPVGQPFDAPRDAAMALYLHSDTAAVEGPTRLRLQVGLKGAERQGGRRPAMNVGLLVDLRDAAGAGAAARIRALITALERVRQPGDRFSLTVAGPGGGVLVTPEAFRHGPLRLAMERMFGPSPEPGAAVDLQKALALATESVRRGDDATAVLGSSLVVLVTGSSLSGELGELERMAHRNAVDGIPLSVVSLAQRDDLAQIDRLVAAGQGQRRVLDSAQGAEALVDRELHAASRAVARALRLRVRLAPGVKLVDVLGSRPLGEPQAQRVREAEQSIDRRLARNLGIQADRGEDEEGIQIVIPNFHAGDAHVILLDVVAEQPGELAEVTLRYKDVVNLENGVARAGLALGEGPAAPGPLERNVLKNLVAQAFATRTRAAGRHLAAGNLLAARGEMIRLRALIHGLRLEVPEWHGDPDLLADERLLDDYLTVLASPRLGDPEQARRLGDSLQVAAFRKLRPAPR